MFPLSFLCKWNLCNCDLVLSISFCLRFLIISKAGRWHQFKKGEFYATVKQKDKGQKKKNVCRVTWFSDKCQRIQKGEYSYKFCKWQQLFHLETHSLVHSRESDQQTQIHGKSGFVFYFWTIWLNYFEHLWKCIIKKIYIFKEGWKINDKSKQTNKQ